MPLPTVFVAGSRQISRLPADVKNRLDTTIEKRFRILLRAATGVDEAVQRHLADKSYLNVEPGEGPGTQRACGPLRPV